MTTHNRDVEPKHNGPYQRTLLDRVSDIFWLPMGYILVGLAFMLIYVTESLQDFWFAIRKRN